MRRLLVVLSIVAALAAGVLLLMLLSLNRLLAGQQARITAAATAAVGRPVSIGRITASLWGGIGMRLQDVQIAEDPPFGTGAFVRAASATAHAHWWPLLRGRLEIGRLDIQDPEVHLIRSAGGQWNYATLRLKRTGAATASPIPLVRRVSAQLDAPEPGVAAPALQIDTIDLADGTVLVTDRSVSPARTMTITHVDLTVHDVSRTAPMQVQLGLTINGTQRNVALQGRVGPLGTSVPVDVNGHLGPFAPAGVTIDNLHLQGAVSPDRIAAQTLDGRAFGGSFAFTGDYPLRGGTATLRGRFENIRLDELLALHLPDANRRIGGLAQVAVDLRSPPGTPANTTGTVTADVRDGVLKGFNLVDAVIGHLTGLPGISHLISANVKPKYARLFSDPDTHFQTLHGRFLVADQRLRTDDLTITATDYGVRATGWFGFDRSLDLDGTLLMSKRFTDDLTADVKEARYLSDSNGQLAVPFRVSGSVGAIKVRPDSDYLTGVLARALGRGAVGNLLQGLLGAPPKGAPGQPTPRPPAGDLGKALRGLLGH